MQKISSKAFQTSFFISLVLTSILTFAFMASNYLDFKNRYQATIDIVQSNFVLALANASWTYDDAQIKSLLTGIKKLPYVSGLSLEVPPYFSYTDNLEDGLSKISIPVDYHKNEIGTLTLYMNPKLMQAQLTDLAYRGLIFALIFSIIMGLLIYIFIKKLVSERIIDLSRQVEAFNIEESRSEFHLLENETAPLELKSITEALNRMIRSLARQRAKNEVYRRKLESAANYDALTKLPNRHHAENTVSSLIAQQEVQRFAAVFINFGSFKSLNESYGRLIGDKFLFTIAKRLIALFPDAYCARITKDHFLVVLTDSDMDTLSHNIEQLNATLSKPVDIIGAASPIELKVFVGVALYPDTSIDPEHLFTHGEMALRIAKKENAPVIYNNRMAEVAQVQNKIRLFLPKAIRDNELYLNYQPIIDARDEKIVGMECLIRWNHKDIGFIRPDIFIEIAEEEGLIPQIDNFLFSQSMQDFKQIQQHLGKDIVLSLNVSYQHFREQNFVNFVVDQIEKHDFNPSSLKLEITERIFLHDHQLVLDKMNHLIEMGISIAIDDFGTGYSAINSVKSFPFTTLKIDKSFVSAMSGNERDYHLVRNVIKMAHDLELEVIAEGVETAEQVKALLEANCHLIQGFYYERPRPISYFLSSEKEVK